MSVQRNLPALRMVIERSHFNFGEYSDHFAGMRGSRLSRTASEFTNGLGQFIDIGGPPIQGLTFLESNEATPADVFVYWHAILQVYLNSNLFKQEYQIPAAAYRIDYVGILYPTVFKQVMHFLSTAAKAEIKFGSKPQLTKWKGHGSEFKKKLLDEL
ncbi:hypothetical protein H0H81_003082 [Sphagnurus paluster]|uniref:Uncharacterized protein n=1 Tax=Sphagnurus paluster TaxID=117069 RepID=A0A9P7KIB2_9AGAR|nr:hypothetical protein H0H81_003082 [Sphagnurus paluster]